MRRTLGAASASPQRIHPLLDRAVHQSEKVYSIYHTLSSSVRSIFAEHEPDVERITQKIRRVLRRRIRIRETILGEDSSRKQANCKDGSPLTPQMDRVLYPSRSCGVLSSSAGSTTRAPRAEENMRNECNPPLLSADRTSAPWPQTLAPNQ